MAKLSQEKLKLAIKCTLCLMRMLLLLKVRRSSWTAGHMNQLQCYCSLACSNDDGGALDSCVAGDHTLLTLNGTFEPDTIHAGHVIVRGGAVAAFLVIIRRLIEVGRTLL